MSEQREPEQLDQNRAGAEPGEPPPAPPRPRRPLPPVEHQFKPGQSGNPGGRPKGTSLTAVLRRVLEREHQGRPIGELLVERLVKEALSGKLPHLKEVLDRVEGRVVERMKLETNAAPGVVVLHMPPPRVIGEPEADAAARSEHEQQSRQLSGQAPPGSKVVVGDCWLKT